MIHGNNKEDELLRRSAELGALIVLDSLDELERAQAAGGSRFLVRVTPGIEADTHEAVKTAHHGSKFGLPPDDAVERSGGSPRREGLHVHVGSQLHALRRVADDSRLGRAVRGARSARSSAGRRASSTSAAGSASATCSTSRRSRSASSSAGSSASCSARGVCSGCPQPQLMLEPGRSLVSRAGVTLYTVGVVKRASAATTYVTVDGGMSDNPRPAMYNARYAALLATRADAEPSTACTPSRASTASRATC